MIVPRGTQGDRQKRFVFVWAGLVLLAWAGLSVHRAINENTKVLRQIVAAQQRAAVAQAKWVGGGGSAGGGGGSTAAAAAVAQQQQRAQTQAQRQQQQSKMQQKHGASPQEMKPIPPVWDRYELIQLLQKEDLKTGAELGVLVGEYAERVLSNWTSCTKYYLVDLWDVQENYEDLANLGDKGAQEQRFQETKTRLAPWENKTVFLRMFTTEAAKRVPDGSLDFVYVDARHDYCGVMDDLEAWWPKMRSGGIFAGHDYVEATHGLVTGSGQDWSKCQNGTIHLGAVKGAVDDFAAARALSVSVTEDGGWATWMMRVP